MKPDAIVRSVDEYGLQPFLQGEFLDRITQEQYAELDEGDAEAQLFSAETIVELDNLQECRDILKKIKKREDLQCDCGGYKGDKTCGKCEKRIELTDAITELDLLEHELLDSDDEITEGGC